MNELEAQRIATAINDLRPDWPIKSLLTLIHNKLMTRPRRDVALALTWVACDSVTQTPARVLEAGPWWRAAAVDDPPPRPEQIPPSSLCSICSNPEPRCRQQWADDHEFLSVTDHRAQVRTTTTPPADVADRIAAYDQAATEAREAGAPGKGNWYAARAQLLDRHPPEE